MTNKRKTIPISMLKLDQNNYRFEAVATQREAIKAMLDDRHKVSALAADILEVGLNPSEQFIVTPDEEQEGHFIVCEGNRRVTALKVMDNPDFAKGTSAQRKFSQLAEEFEKRPIREIECVIMANKTEANIWVERKHKNEMEGKGVERWDAQAESRYNAEIHNRVSPSKAILDYLKSKKKLHDDLKKELSRRTTNIDRVFQMPYVRQRLGVVIEKDGIVSFENGRDEDGTKLLLTMLSKLADPLFTVRELIKSDQRIAFIDGFAHLSVKRSAHPSPTQEHSPKSEHTSPPGNDESDPGQNEDKGDDLSDIPEEEPTKGKKPLRSISKRKTLAPTGSEFTFHVVEPRLRDLYREAREIDVDKFPNCSSMLVRVFLELSTEAYLKKSGASLPKGKNAWSDIGINLKDKIETILKKLDPEKKSRRYENARNGISSNDAFIHSINTLHGFVHGMDIRPDPAELKKTWDRWHEFLRDLHTLEMGS